MKKKSVKKASGLLTQIFSKQADMVKHNEVCFRETIDGLSEDLQRYFNSRKQDIPASVAYGVQNLYYELSMLAETRATFEELNQIIEKA